MRTWPCLGLLLLATLLIQVTAEDLYWENDEDTSNEFLEVKEDSGIVGHLKRMKRQWWFPFSPVVTTSTTPAPENEAITEDQDDTVSDVKDDEDHIDNGSGSGPDSNKVDVDTAGEKTLRVTFVVVQPYQKEYSNRDSPQFQQFSNTLAQAVNVLFDKLPGTQKASLIRIQSRLSDNFSCKVTLDVVTSGYEDTDRITDVLREHIRNYRYLGDVSVKDDDFSANVVNPGSAIETCRSDEIQCDDDTCISETARCNGSEECSDGSDERGCPVDDLITIDQQSNAIDSNAPADPECTNYVPCAASSSGEVIYICADQRCDGHQDCPLGDDEAKERCSPQSQSGFERGDQSLIVPGDLDEPNTTPYSTPQEYTCPAGEFRCDETRCISRLKLCDQEQDCTDNSDELNCPETCSEDDFRCNNGQCIESWRKCDHVFDCHDHEDEEGCACGSDEFQCVSDGICIEKRKRCDGHPNCRDESDEHNCDACSSDQWQCDQGNCIQRNKRCNGRVDCPSDRSDERNCVARGHFKCSSGKVISESLRCNRRYDCPSGDYSDEQNCPCGEQDFKCNNGHCIPKNKRCDRTNDCQDGSDELWCTYGKECMAYEFKCTNGQCVHAESHCNGTAECTDGSDEIKCPCKRGQFRCRDGSCINIALRCNGYKDCRKGEDEVNCGEPRCPEDSFTCSADSSVKCATRCDRNPECDDEEDEEECRDVCTQECGDGTCLDDGKICDGHPDCPDGRDEEACDKCDRLEDFRCQNGECIRASQRCNNITECYDNSDELNCNEIMTATHEGCPDNQYKCRDGTCINPDFLCDGRADCYDKSDEENCPWYMMRASRSPSLAPCRDTEFTCNEGRCIPSERRCDNYYDCSDFSDEQNCHAACKEDEFQCYSGECIPKYYKCDGSQQCRDWSDERECGSTRPVTPTTEYPQYQPATPPSNPVYTTTDLYSPGRAPNAGRGQGGGYPPQYDPYAPGTGLRPENRLPSYGQASDRQPEFTTRPNGDVYSDPNAPSRGEAGTNVYETTSPEYDPYPYGGGTPGYTSAPGSDGGQGGRPDYSGSNSDPNGGGTSSYPGASGDGSGQSGQPGYPGSSSGQYGGGSYPGAPGGGSEQGGQPGYPGSSSGQYGGGNYPGGGSGQGGQPGNPSSSDQYGGGSYPGSPGGGYGQGGQPGYPGSSDQYSGGRHPGAPGGGSGQGGQPDYSGSSGNQNGGGSYPSAPGGGSGQGSQSGYPGSSDQYGSYPGESGGGSGQGGQPGSSDQYGGGSDPSSPGSGQGGQSVGSAGSYPGSSDGGRPWSGSQSGGSVRGGSVPCHRNEWRCENGPCIDAHLRCDGHVDCPYDVSDEIDCTPGSPINLKVKTYPTEQSVRFGTANAGGDVVFQCRDESAIRAPVRWVREGGRSLKPGSTDRNGRLELFNVTVTDSGIYICQTPSHLGKPGSEVRVTLTVENYRGPPERPPFVPCQLHEATCGNGDCIPRSSVCDGKIDCADRSDEDMCTTTGMCEPNQFQCVNRKCVLKTWLCDSENDCGDGSDEQNCAPPMPGQPCLSSEFSCHTGGQCIPKSFHCDGRSDCMDQSDELGCAPVYVVKPPTPANLRLNTGDTLVLRAEARGNPVPVISWRLNWGHVPAQCTATSEGGVGVLTCHNMQPEHSGAYSAEALNNKGTTFANPDSIVFVSQTSPCPAGYFNDEARSEQDCIRCFCFGESKQCKSADLFTYNMATPLGQGGTQLQGVAITQGGEVRTDGSITNHYYYQPLRNGATVTKLRLPSPDDRSLGNFHPYLTLPESYNGQQLTSYGGHIKYALAPHSRAYFDDSAPTIIVKGRYTTLFHFHRDQGPLTQIPIEVRLTPENWVKPGPSGFDPASREDVMMALDYVEKILLRADLNDAGVNITNFVMESAQHINVGMGAANLVEECTCPPGYEGLSCQKCSPGYVREKSGPWLGNCVREACPAGTYGDPGSGLACRPCPCPLTNRDNQFARTCSLGPDGRVTCDCFPGYEGQNCDKCAPGYSGNPLVQGDTCRVREVNRCNGVGTETTRLLDECMCKDNVQGRYCDQCKNNSFYLSNDFREGCALCFCSGVSHQCMSSNLRRKTTSVNFNVPNIVDQVKVYNSAPAGVGGVLRYGAPAESELKPVLTSGGLTIRGYDRSRPTVYYWSMPLSFAGDKVTSYGGYLRYTLDNVPSYISARDRNGAAADVQLISDNHLTFQYTGEFKPSSEGVLNASVQFLETGWHRSDGKEVSRELFLLALADVKAILIKASYGEIVATPLFASIETAEPDGGGLAALHVEQCSCPAGYIGTSCEDCAPGYTRSSSGLYLEHCDLCECNGHSKQCHPETGQCYECRDNTDGPHCELCQPGYERDSYDNCVETEGASSTYAPCRCDPRGTVGSCDENGRCYCKANVEGQNCDRCRAGTFGLETRNPDGCIACFCSGATQECQEANHYTRIPMAAPIFGDDYGGYTLTDLNAERVINDQFLPIPDKSELMYVFTDLPSGELFWSLPVFPGNRVTSYGGTLSLRQEFKSDESDALSVPGTDVVLAGDDISVYWTNPNQLRSGQSLSYQVPLTENGWYKLGTAVPASRSDFMRVLKGLRRVLVRATITDQTIASSTIADVSMDTATESFQPGAPAALGVEICACPPGHLGTSCESCAAGYYKDEQDYCTQCPCAGHDCQLDAYGRVTCNCRPPYTGSDCSAIGLVMELHPEIREDTTDPTKRIVILTCKYSAPEPLMMKFVITGVDQMPLKWANESELWRDEWRGEHVLRAVWDTREAGPVYECHTLTSRGSTLGVLTTDMRDVSGKGSAEVGESQTTTGRPSPPVTTVTVRITSPTIRIQEVGTSVNFTCQAQSRINTNRLRVTWSKDSGYLPQGRSYVDQNSGLLKITNLQISDSGVYICQTNDGISTGQAAVTLRVPANEMTLPRVSIRPAVNEYFEGDRIQLECIATGNPAPSISWQRASRRPLPISSLSTDAVFIIDRARVEDSGEYRCTATNTAGSGDSIAVITVRQRPSRPPRDRLVVNPTAPVVYEGQSTRVVCTGSTNVPAGTIDWVRQDNGRFQANVRSDNGVLYIDRASLDNQGVYQCQTHAADVDPVSVLLTVNAVGTPPPGDVSEIAVPVTSLKIAAGESGTVECTPSGSPMPLIKWTKYKDNFGVGTSQRGDILIINNAQESDQGYYVCEGLINGQLIKNIYVYVEIDKREAPVVSIWPEGEQPVALGSTFEFQCRVGAGIPEPDVTWSRSGGRALSRTTEIKPNNILRFEKVDVNDEGEYICTGSNLAGSASASAVVKVRSPPEITLSPTNFLTVRNSDPINMECRAQGYPEPSVTIRDPNRREISPPSLGIATIRISAATDSDDGEYTCTASSAAGTIEERFVIRVDRGDGGFTDFGGSGENEINPGKPYDPSNDPNYNPNYDPNSNPNYDPNYDQNSNPNYDPNSNPNYDPNYDQNSNPNYDQNSNPNYDPNYNPNYNPNNQPPQTPRPSDLIVEDGQPKTELDCYVSGDFGARWDRSDRKPLQRNAVQEGNKLVIYNISSSDSGEYMCSMYNYQTSDVQTARSISLLVVRRPRIELRPPTQTVHPGQSPTVECVVEGDNILDIHWEPVNRNPSRRVEIRNSTLIFHQIEVADAGMYKCIAKNQYLNANATAEVIVAEETEVDTSESHENEQWVHVGAAVVLSCNVSAPGVTVYWSKDGRSVLPPLTVVSHGSLHIQSARKTDSGHYECRLRDRLGRFSSNYINLHIEGIECLDTEFHCYDESGCIGKRLLCDGVHDCKDSSDEKDCDLQTERHVEDVRTDPRGNYAELVKIDQPGRRYRAGENVEILCRAVTRNIVVNWEKFGTNQYVEVRRYGDGAMLIVHEVTAADDAGVYRCTGVAPNGQTSYEDFSLEVEPVASNPSYGRERDTPVAKYTARLRESVDLPCNHNLEEPVNIKWRRLYAQLPADARSDQPILHLTDVTEGDAGTYICRVSNNRAVLETSAILRVVGVVPSFNGNSWVALPTIRDAYRKFEIEVAFKPTDQDGLILYNSQRSDRSGDYLALQLNEGVPQLVLETGNGPVYVNGDRPLQLNVWHTIHLNRIQSRVTMNVDNIGPFTNETAEDWILDLKEPLYIGGVRDLESLPESLAGASGFVGCISMLVVDRDEKNIIMDSIDQNNIEVCDSCAPNLCLNDGVCQEARSYRGFVCICPSGFAGENCERRGEACHAGLCGPGKCQDTADGYKCACPLTHTGKNCEETQWIDYPAFTGSAFLAMNAPNSARFLNLAMKVKATSPVQDGIIMYCAESLRGLGGFTSLAVRNKKLEFRYDLNDGHPMVLVSNAPLPANEWTDVQVTRSGSDVSLNINLIEKHDRRLDSPNKSMKFGTPMYVGGVDDELVILNNNTGVTGGFSGCIKDVKTQGNSVNINTSTTSSANVQRCSEDRGDIPELENPCACENGGSCNADGSCSCPGGFAGYHCESRLPPTLQAGRRPAPADPCAALPCRNGGTCRVDYSNMMNHSCECPLGYAGTNCQMSLRLYQSVGFNGNGYLELPAGLIQYNSAEPAIIALAVRTTQNGVLLYQSQLLSQAEYGSGDYVLIRIDRGYVVLEWDMGSGPTSLTIDSKDGFVTDGERHQIIVRFLSDNNVEMTVDSNTVNGYYNGIATRMDADSNIFIGGIRDSQNENRYPGLVGCIEQVEFMTTRAVDLGMTAVASRNAQRCREP